jgi:hypothetical protein
MAEIPDQKASEKEKRPGEVTPRALSLSEPAMPDPALPRPGASSPALPHPNLDVLVYLRQVHISGVYLR